MKLFIILFALGLLLPTTELYSQSIADIRSKISKANEALKGQNYDTALELIDEAQNLAGRTGAIFESVRVQAYYGNQDYMYAKNSLDSFYSLNPSKEAVDKIEDYQSLIDEAIENELAQFERMQRREQDRRAEADRKKRENMRRSLDHVVKMKENDSYGSRVPEIMGAFDKHLSRYPNHTEALAIYSRYLYSQDRQTLKAAELAKQAFQAAPNNAYALHAYGVHEYENNNYEKAQKYLIEAEKQYNFSADVALPWGNYGRFIRDIMKAYFEHYKSTGNQNSLDQAVHYVEVDKEISFGLDPLHDEIMEAANIVSSDDEEYDYKEYDEDLLVFLDDNFNGLLVSFQNKDSNNPFHSNTGVLTEYTLENFQKRVDEQQKQGRFLADLEYGVFSTDVIYIGSFQSGFSGDTKIFKSSSTTELRKKISEYWKQGYTLTDTEYMFGDWYGVMVQDNDFPANSYSIAVSKEKMLEQIRNAAGQGYNLISTEYGDGQHFMVFLKAGFGQSLAVNEYKDQPGIELFLSSNQPENWAIMNISIEENVQENGPALNVISEKNFSNGTPFHKIYEDTESLFNEIRDIFEKGYVIKNIEVLYAYKDR